MSRERRICKPLATTEDQAPTSPYLANLSVFTLLANCQANRIRVRPLAVEIVGAALQPDRPQKTTVCRGLPYGRVRGTVQQDQSSDRACEARPRNSDGPGI